ncbi:tripartite tricarboxylate transporter substrate binding protein [Variovorax sp. J22P271]|uniref:Bug family tripartite tricarboxylate transporter substrate binding protein n=1 Tax=Variovorax davisae TaxID=3053515 RepID=UPI0025787D7A|nr:tripartite tricarboxylate transporter substrate binding protein [Variovorax sp. J22P271]MDM0034361.1 tripartite tricarboxylate transporter substrate binding protein [Variovorax sp. J22P271]
MFLRTFLRRCGALAVTAAAAIGVQPAVAQTGYPERPVRVVVPYPAGGNTDVIARAVMKEVSARMGQPFVIDNKPGGNSILGTDMVAKSAPDGYTLLVVIGAYANNQWLYKSLPYGPNDLTPITQISRTSLVLVSTPQLAVNSMAEFLAAVRPSGQATYASSGVGSAAHLLGERFAQAAGFKATHIPYKGTADAISDLVGGRVGFMFDAVSAIGPQIRAGKLDALAVTGSTRSAQLPGVPTVVELGFPQLVSYAWAGLLAPARTPEPIRQRLAAEIAAVLQSPELKERLAAISTDAVGSTPAEFTRFLAEENRIGAEVIRSAGIRLD